MKRNGTETRTKDNLTKTLTAPDPSQLADTERIGKDEMNLVEHPFALLRYGHTKSAVIDIVFEKPHPVTKKMVKSSWHVAGHAELGLPGPLEERLYLALMEITREAGMPQWVPFSRRDVMRRIGLSGNKRDYQSLSDAFTRLESVLIKAERAFWDKAQNQLLPRVSFSVIDNTVFAEEKPGPKIQGTLALSAFRWNDVIYNSMQGGYLRTLNTEFALSLDLPLALRLYRYLDRHRYGKAGPRGSFQIELHRLCETHLGMAPSPYASKLKERLKPAHDELMARGFLARVEYSEMKTRKGNQKVTYTFGDGVPLVEEAALPLPAMSEDEACDVVLTRLKTEDADEYLRIRTDAIELLNEIERAIWERSGETGVAWARVQEHMRIIVEQEYRGDVQELMG